MAAVLTDNQVTASDRLSLTLFIATVFHGILILGISFSNSLMDESLESTPLDVVLVHTYSEETPEDAKRIAQQNQMASGSVDEDNTPREMLNSQIPSVSGGASPMPQEQRQQMVEEKQSQQYLHTLQADRSITSEDNTKQERKSPTRDQRQRTERQMEIARLAAEIERGQRQYAQRPKIHFIDALSAKSASEARYIDDWVNKVEGIGNLNYPNQARREHISGKLILNVLLDNTGNVLRVQVAISSGSKVLDEGAIQIVRMSSPFPAFSVEMRNKYDQLMITRTWKFNTQGL